MQLKLIIISGILILAYTQPGWCFDDDISINEPNFKSENFLDYKAYEFRKSVQEEWYTVENGWRMAGGSLSADIAFVDSEIRLQKALSDTLTVRLQHEHDVYYAIKPVSDPLVEMAIRPWRKAIELSFLGTVAFDKRQSDLGFAFTLGERKANYLRLVWLSVDHYYNEKNTFDSSYYTQKPRTLSFQSAYRYDRWQLRLATESDRPLTLVMPDTTSTFHYENEKLELVLDYHYSNNALLGLAYRGWNTDKSLAEVVENRSQTLSHHLIDVYWLGPIRQNDELTIGFRFDRFINNLHDINDSNGDYDYQFDTWQVYGLLNHDYSPHAGWGLGLYIGHTEENKDYLSIATDNKPNNELQAKLRTSWEYRSFDSKDRLTFHFTFNLDELITDPGDGGGISYQGLF